MACFAVLLACYNTDGLFLLIRRSAQRRVLKGRHLAGQRVPPVRANTHDSDRGRVRLSRSKTAILNRSALNTQYLLTGNLFVPLTCMFTHLPRPGAVRSAANAVPEHMKLNVCALLLIRTERSWQQSLSTRGTTLSTQV